MQHVAPVEEFPLDKWDLIIALNLNAAFHTTRLAVPHMKAQKWGRIIQTASAHSPGRLAVQVGLCDGEARACRLHQDGGAGGRRPSASTANCISPGYVWTPLVENQIPDTMKARGLTREQVINDVLLEGQPTKQFVTAEQVAATALFLCRDEASQITRANLLSDGGWTAE